MFRLPLFFVFPVLIQMSSLRYSNRSKRPSSRAAVQAPPPQRRRLTVQQDELAVAVPPPPEPAAAVRLSRPVQLLVSYHFSKPTWPLQLQLPPFRLLRVQRWCLSTPLHQPCRSYHQLLVRQWHQCLQRSLKNLQHLLPSAPGPSSTRTVHQAQMSSLLLPLLQLLLLLTQSQTLLSRLLLLPPIHYKVFRKPTLNGNLRGNLYTPADLSFDAQSGSMQLESRHRSGPTSILI